MRFIKAGFLQQAATFIVGSSTMLLTLAKTYVAVVTYVITFAIADGMMVTSVIIECMELVEDSKRASTFGFFMLFGGIVGMTSPPFAGSLSLINISCVLITLLSHPITGNPIMLFGGIVGMTSPPFAGSLSLINIQSHIQSQAIRLFHPSILPSHPISLRRSVVHFFCPSVGLSASIYPSIYSSISFNSFNYSTT